MGAVKKSGLALFLALTGSVAMGGQAALADTSTTISLPAAPAPDALLSHGIGTAAQVVALSVPDQGHDGLLDADGNLVDRLTIDGVGTYQIDVDGILTFRPALGYVGTHSVVYRAIDAFDQTGDGTYTPEVDQPAAPAAPTVTSSGVGTALQSAPVDVPSQGTAVLLDSTGAETTTTSLPGVGAFRIDSTSGALTFAPAFGYRGTASISYRVTDAYGQSTAGAYTLSVAAAPAEEQVVAGPPVAHAAHPRRRPTCSRSSGSGAQRRAPSLVDRRRRRHCTSTCPARATTPSTRPPRRSPSPPGGLRRHRFADLPADRRVRPVSQSAYTPTVLRTPKRPRSAARARLAPPTTAAAARPAPAHHALCSCRRSCSRPRPVWPAARAGPPLRAGPRQGNGPGRAKARVVQVKPASAATDDQLAAEAALCRPQPPASRPPPSSCSSSPPPRRTTASAQLGQAGRPGR